MILVLVTIGSCLVAVECRNPQRRRVSDRQNSLWNSQNNSGGMSNNGNPRFGEPILLNKLNNKLNMSSCRVASISNQLRKSV